MRDDRPQVIMNTVCPGVVKTSLARDYQARGGFGMRLVVGAFQGLFGKSASDGARSYLAAVTTKESQHVSLRKREPHPLRSSRKDLIANILPPG